MYRTFFPIKISLQPMEGWGVPRDPIRYIEKPEDIPKGVPFKVLETQVVCFAGPLDK